MITFALTPSLSTSQIHPNLPILQNLCCLFFQRNKYATDPPPKLMLFMYWCRTSIKAWPTHQEACPQNKWTLPTQKPSVIHSTSVELMNPISLHSRILTGLILYRSCAGNHSCSDLVSAEVLLHLRLSILNL